MVLASHTLSNGRLHQSRERRKNVDRGVDVAVVETTVDEDLTLSDVACQIRNGVSDIIVGHGENRDLGDGSVTALDTTSTFVDGRQIRVHVTGVTTTTGHLFTGSGDLTEGIAVSRKIGKNDQDVLLELVGVVLGGRKGETRGNDTLDTEWELVAVMRTG